MIAYPSVADWWNTFHQSRAMATYASAVASLDQNRYNDLLTEAREYNRRIAEKGINWNLSDAELDVYNKTLSIDNRGIMGYIDIPKISVQLPV